MKGFTLIETIIYIALIGMVILNFVFFTISIINSRNKSYVQQEVQANARVALDLMAQKIRGATWLNTTTSVFSTDPGVLSLEMIDGLVSPTVFSLNQDDGVLEITEAGSDPVTLTSNEIKITNLIFTNLTGTSSRSHVRIELTAEYIYDEDVVFRYSQNLQTAVSLRK